MKDTYFSESIDYLKKCNKPASIAILKVNYDMSKIDIHLNSIGLDILKSDGEPLSVAIIINKYLKIS